MKDLLQPPFIWNDFIWHIFCEYKHNFDVFRFSLHLVHADDLIEGFKDVEAAKFDLELVTFDFGDILQILQLEHTQLVAELNGENYFSYLLANLHWQFKDVRVLTDCCKLFHDLTGDANVCELYIHILLSNLVELIEMSVLGYSNQVTFFIFVLNFLFAHLKHAPGVLINLDWIISRRNQITQTCGDLDEVENFFHIRA